MTKKIHEWLSELSSHDIYRNTPLSEEFTRETGHTPCWPVHSEKETREAVKRRGLGGIVKPTSDGLSYGYEIAEALSNKYTSFKPWQSGRGFRFRSSLDALQKADV